MKTLEWIVLALIIIGAINWGLIGFFQVDMIAMMFGGMHAGMSRILYAAVGLAGIYGLTLFARMGSHYSHHRD